MLETVNLDVSLSCFSVCLSKSILWMIEFLAEVAGATTSKLLCSTYSKIKWDSPIELEVLNFTREKTVTFIRNDDGSLPDNFT